MVVESEPVSIVSVLGVSWSGVAFLVVVESGPVSISSILGVSSS